jgi:predicted RNA-binding Zn ribbon-like protein
VTGQELFDSYEQAGVVIAAGLVNAVAVEHAFGRPAPRTDPLGAIREVLRIDPPSAAQLRERDVPGMTALAQRLREVCEELDRGDLDAAAARLNDLLAAHSVQPHLAKERGRWRLHHHPADAALVAMMTAICAEGVARLVGAGAGGRVGVCASEDCDRVFLDNSKNASRRFCSITCQNRVKAAAFRRRRATSPTRAS